MAHQIDDTADMDAVVQRVRSELAPGQRTGFVSGNFNVLHPGHLRILRFAAENCDLLVVGVNPNDSPGVTVDQSVRLESLRDLRIVDHAFILPVSAVDFIERLHPEIVVKGKEFATQKNPEKPVLDRYGGQLVFFSGDAQYSSLNLLRREERKASFSVISKAYDFPKRHNFALNDLKAVLPRFRSLRVMVLGDLIVDKYTDCDAVGMSQEDPTIVVTPLETETFLGGAGIVAAHAAGLGADVRFFTVLGDDPAGETAGEMLRSYGVHAHAFTDQTRPTSTKERLRATGKTMLRVNRLRQHSISKELIDEMAEDILDQLDGVDLLLFSDFNYGCLPQALIDRVIAEGARRGIRMAADSQASSQISDISRFKGMDLVTPTEREVRLALKDAESGLAVIAANLGDTALARNVLVTLGAEGVLIHGLEPNGEYTTDRLPAFNQAPQDVAGGGDSLFVSAAMAMAAGCDIWQSTYIGSLAAAYQVSRVGNLPLDPDMLVREIDLPEDIGAAE